MTPIIQIENVTKTFALANGASAVRALEDVSNHVDKGEVLVIIGPSGSGKSTLLRTLNGLETIDSGRIVIDGVELTDRKTDMNQRLERMFVCSARSSTGRITLDFKTSDECSAPTHSAVR